MSSPSTIRLLQSIRLGTYFGSFMDIITHYWNQLIEMYDLLVLGSVTCGAFFVVGILYFLFGNNIEEGGFKRVNTQKYTEWREIVRIAEDMIAAFRADMNEVTLKFIDLEKAKVNAEDALKHALANQTEWDSDKDLEMEKLKEEKKKWLAEKELMTDKCARLENLIKGLNSDASEIYS